MMHLGLFLVALGMFLPWYSWALDYGPRGDGFIGVELAIVGIALFFLTSLLLIAVVTKKFNVVILACILLLVLDLYILRYWGWVYRITWDRLAVIELMPVYIIPPPAIGFFATVVGSVLAMIGGVKAREAGRGAVGNAEATKMKSSGSRTDLRVIGRRIASIRGMIAVGGIIVAIGIFLPWCDFSERYHGSGYHGFLGVELAYVGVLLAFLAVMVAVGVVATRPTLSALAGILLLLTTMIIWRNWDFIFKETWVRIERVTPFIRYGLAIGFYVTILGSIATVAASFASFLKRSEKRAEAQPS